MATKTTAYEPVIVQEAQCARESQHDSNIAEKSPISWKTFISSDKIPSPGLTFKYCANTPQWKIAAPSA
jgi:hypothetical protein